MAPGKRVRGIRDPKNRLRGNSLVEFSLLMPWYVFLFVGAFDWGFYAYSLIATQNAARVAALSCSLSSSTASDSTTACNYALAQLRYMPNVGSSTITCPSAVTAVASLVTGADGGAATSVTVTYQTPQLIPIPKLLPGQITISRTVQMKVRS